MVIKAIIRASFLSLILLVSTVNLAYGKTYELYGATTKLKTEFVGPYPGGQMGAQMATGDIDGDAVPDLIVSSPFASTADKKWNGVVRVIFGGDDAEKQSIEIYGDGSGDQLGTAMDVADFDRDGLDDIVVSSLMDSAAGNNEGRIGKVDILYGKDLLTSRETTQVTSRNLSKWSRTYFIGKNAGDLYGLVLKSTDINEDDMLDLIVSAPQATIKNVDNTGAVYIYLATREGIDPYHDFVFTGQNASERFGSAVKHGDFNGDGRIDFVIGAPQAHNDEISQAGKVYVYYDFIDRKQSPIEVPDLILHGDNSKQWFGFSLDAGNLNGDGYDDLIVSSFPFNGKAVGSVAKAYYGENLNTGRADILIGNPLPQLTMGAKVMLKDLNDDQRPDIIIGSPDITDSEIQEGGDVYVIYNSDAGYREEYSVVDLEMDSLIHGETAGDWFGYNFQVLDFNDDGFEDLAVSARYADAEDGVNNGKVYVFYGDSKPFGRARPVFETQNEKVSRAEFIRLILENFDLKTKKAKYLENCMEYKEFCLFNFMAMSGFDEIKLEPELKLYPDVGPDSEYYDDINTATMLGIITGFLDEENSPFNPDREISRIQALKIILAASDLVPSKYQFELVSMLGSYANLLNQVSYFKDVDSHLPHMWWYPRYTNYAREHDIIDRGEYFRPDENITAEELNDMIIRTLDSIK